MEALRVLNRNTSSNKSVNVCCGIRNDLKIVDEAKNQSQTTLNQNEKIVHYNKIKIRNTLSNLKYFWRGQLTKKIGA